MLISIWMSRPRTTTPTKFPSRDHCGCCTKQLLRSRFEDETKRITTFLLYAEGAAETVIRSSPVGCCARGMPHHRPHQWRDTGRQVLSVCFGAESKNLIVRAPLKKSDCVCVCYRWQDVLKDPECQCKPASPKCSCLWKEHVVSMHAGHDAYLLTLMFFCM